MKISKHIDCGYNALPYLYNKDSLLNKDVGYFIGNSKSERLGLLKFSVMVFDTVMNNNAVNVEIYNRLEILYSEFVPVFSSQHVIAISDDFDLVGGDEFIPEYKTIVIFDNKNMVDSCKRFALGFDEFVEQVTKDFAIKFERVL